MDDIVGLVFVVVAIGVFVYFWGRDLRTPTCPGCTKRRLGRLYLHRYLRCPEVGPDGGD